MTSIYEQVGGAAAFDQLTHAMNERCVADPVLEHAFARADLRPDHLERLSGYLGEVFGGPPVYSGDFGGESAMQEVHAGNDPDEDWYERFLACFLLALDDAGFPEDPGLRSAMQSFMEGALERMKQYAPTGSTVPPDLPMPSVT